MTKSVMGRVAYAYALLLFGLNTLFLILCLLLHVSVLTGTEELNRHFGKIVLVGAFIAVFPVFAFLRNSLKWVQEIRRSPTWMWKGALGLGAYALLVFCLLMFIFPDCEALFQETLIGSAYMMGFTAISLCILYAALWSGTVEGPELIRMARNSVAFVCLTAILFAADRAGFFRHHPHVENQRIDSGP